MVLYLAENKRVVSSSELSEIINISQRYSMQIVAKLRDGGLIGTTIGVSGGYTLLKDPSLISVYEIVLLMEGTIIITEGGSLNITSKSKIDDTLSLLKDYVEAYLRSITLDKLADKGADNWEDMFFEMIEKHITELRHNTQKI